METYHIYFFKTVIYLTEERNTKRVTETQWQHVKKYQYASVSHYCTLLHEHAPLNQ